MSRKFWLITGVHCKDWIDNIKENYRRCRTEYTELVVVENGDGIGLWDQTDDLNEHVITSDPGAANYINAGVEYAKKYGKQDDWFLKFDSDDFYGKDRVRQAAELAYGGAEACGSISIFVKTETGDLFALDSKIEAGDIIPKTHSPHGPTLGGKLEKTVEFIQPPEPWGEDANWVHAMRDSGVDFYTLPLNGFAYVRHRAGTHTFPVPEGLARHLWFMAAYNLGEWDVDIVEGNKKPEKVEFIPYSSRGTHDACEFLLQTITDNMNIHPLKKSHIDSLNTKAEESVAIERQVGNLQIQIQGAQNQIANLSQRHSEIAQEMQDIANEIAEDFDALKTAGRVILERGVFVEGVPTSLSNSVVVEAIDDYFKRAEEGKSSIKDLKEEPDESEQLSLRE